MHGGIAVTRAERERQLQWLMTLRVVIVSTLLISAFAIEILVSPMLSLRPLFLLTAGSYGLVLLYAVLDRWLSGTTAFVVLQLIGDVLCISLFVQITGGLDSPMSFLYLLPITVGAMLLHRSEALLLAAVCFASYTSVIIFGAAWSLFGRGGASSLEREPGRVVYFLTAHAVAMVAVALLSSYLAQRLHAQSRELVERRGAVARLQALNENIIESINSGLLTTDLGWSINFINRGGMEIIGYSHEEVEGRDVESLLGLEPGFLHEIRRRLPQERRVRFERYFGTKHGREIFLGVAISNLYDKIGRPLGYIFIFQDLTEINALEQEVRLHERMVALGEMAAGMAHELRNPLASISGAVQYLKGDLKPQGEVLELMDIILRESDRLDQAIRDFLMFTRPGEFAPVRSDLVRLIEDQLKLLRKSREFTRGHSIQAAYESSEMHCEIDPNRIKQVFWNLATNALKAMDHGGTLTIDVRWASNERVEVRFSDEGVGMNERQRQLYFQPFSSSFREGTGLGAAIVYRLVEEHGGKIALESAENQGTTVHMLLPRKQRTTTDGAAIAPVKWAIGG